MPSHGRPVYDFVAASVPYILDGVTLKACLAATVASSRGWPSANRDCMWKETVYGPFSSVFSFWV